jgi:peptide/nickel transport system permease protein
MTTIWVRKILQYVLVIFVATTLNFLIPLAMPGDPLKAILGENIFGMSQEQIAKVRADYGLDLPVHEQYVHYLGKLIRLDLGYSYRFKQPISEMIRERLPWTLFLTFTSLIISVLVGSALGVWAAWRRGQASDVGLLALLLGLQSLPAFWLAMVLIAVFAVQLRWLPVFGGKSVATQYTGVAHYVDLIRHWILPATTLILVSIPGWFLTMRYSMLGTLNADYIRTARAKGLSERWTMFRHAMRNALLPVVTGLMLGLAYAVSGATLIETVFSYPGIGRMLFEAVLMRDYPVIRATFLIITLTVVVANLIADLLYPLLDPRLKVKGQ